MLGSYSSSRYKDVSRLLREMWKTPLANICSGFGTRPKCFDTKAKVSLDKHFKFRDVKVLKTRTGGKDLTVIIFPISRSLNVPKCCNK